MDRVLLLMDDLQGASHLEMTLRKVGFDVEIITNEFHLSEKLLSFNPDYILVKGSGSRVSTLSVGKKLKENFKFNGKVILVFAQNNRPNPDELIQIRMDLLLFEPVSAIRLVAQLLLLTSANKELITDKLMRLANTDQQFRQAEMQLLGGTTSIENEIQIVIGKIKNSSEDRIKQDEKIEDNDILSFINPDLAKKSANEFDKSASGNLEENQKNQEDQNSLSDAKDQPKESGIVTEEYKKNLLAELIQAENELNQKLQSYKKATDGIPIDTKIGLSKKDSKKANRALFASLATDEILRLNRLDKEKQEFARALLSTDEVLEKNHTLASDNSKDNNLFSVEDDLAALEAQFELANKRGTDK